MGKEWHSLNKGDIVDVVAPGFGASEKTIKESAEYLESIGLVARIDDNLLGEDLFSSNSKEERFNFLKEALYNNESKAVWCLRGGYGTAPLLPELSKLDPPENVKLLIGFSDITSLHSLINQRWNWSTIHGSGLRSIVSKKVNQETIDLLKSVIFGKVKKQEIKLEQINNIDGNEINSSITGGNLSIIQTTIGTDWQVNADDKILLMEELSETPSAIARMLTHVRQIGILDKAKAVLIGDFSEHKNEEDEKKSWKAIEKFANEQIIPVYRIKGVGHEEMNYPIPLNTKATISNNVLICYSGFITDVEEVKYG